MILKKLIIVFACLSIGIFTNPVFASVEGGENCGIFSVLTAGCDLSTWMHLLLGEIGIAVTTAFFLFYISEKHNKKLKEIIDRIEQIISDQEKVREDRQNYSIRVLKDYLASIKFNVEIINALIDEFNKTPKDASNTRKNINIKVKEVRELISKIDHVLLITSDIIVPEVIDIDKMCKMIRKSLPKDDDKKLIIIDQAKIKPEMHEIVTRMNILLNKSKVE